MEAQHELAPGVGRCPSCGALLAAEAAACPTCGHSAGMEGVTADNAAETPAPASVPVPMPGPNEWRCDWCEAINPLGAARCAACGAVYPHPEQDAMVLRAAEARIQIALEEIELRERIRPQSFWKRLFS